MRRAYVLYHPKQPEDSQVSMAELWPCDGTLLFDTAGPGFASAGRALHGYDVTKAVMDDGPAALEHLYTWDDEVWLAVDIGEIGPDDGLREVIDRVRAAGVPHEWSTSQRG